jgi:hypothetical protein
VNGDRRHRFPPKNPNAVALDLNDFIATVFNDTALEGGEKAARYAYSPVIVEFHTKEFTKISCIEVGGKTLLVPEPRSFIPESKIADRTPISGLITHRCEKPLTFIHGLWLSAHVCPSWM